MKRITISLEDDLYRIVKSYAVSEDISLSKGVVRLMRRGLGPKEASSVKEESVPYRTVDPRTGLPVLHVGHLVTMEDIQEAIDDEDRRILEHFRGRGQ